MVKPLGFRELLARIRALLRRQENDGTVPQRIREKARYHFRRWSLDRRTRRLTDPSGQPVTLTRGEYNLLVAFLEAPQRPLSREHLLHATSIHEDVYDRTIDVQVFRLRRKLETDQSAPRMILTERGIGYTFALAVEMS
jgi:two-component system OmpR family response regulator